MDILKPENREKRADELTSRVIEYAARLDQYLSSGKNDEAIINTYEQSLKLVAARLAQLSRVTADEVFQNTINQSKNKHEIEDLLSY